MSGATTTSIHRLNGDRHLSPSGKLAYVLFNWLNNALPNWRVDPRMAIHDFRRADLQSLWPQLQPGSSPSRRLSDLFWLTLPWERIQQELGAIRVLDIGCGSGHYGPRLISWSDSRVASYAGADLQAQPSWTALPQADPRLRFIQADAAELRDAIPIGTNFLMSQSTIEHLDYDLRFFEHIADYVRRLNSPALQVHLCPSAACLKLYWFHGVRQYTPRTLSHITRLFEDAHIALYALGGRACNQLHYRFITAPLMIWRKGDLRETRAAEYEQRLRAAIEQDMSVPQRSPAFYALIIHSRPRTRLVCQTLPTSPHEFIAQTGARRLHP